MSVQSFSGFNYYVIFIDDYSRKTWIYFLKTKDEVFDRFREFRALVENQSGRRIQVLRSDNGGEYTSNEFVEYCVVEGIKKELMVPYNPQQNGVAECKNRTIVGAVCAMIHDQGLLMFLWVEACRTVVYIQNKSPHTILGKLTPEEVYTGTRPDVSHLASLGVSVTVMSLQRRGQSWTPQERRGYWLVIVRSPRPTTSLCQHRRIVVCRDVQFEEE
jgi:hypothetical protein